MFCITPRTSKRYLYHLSRHSMNSCPNHWSVGVIAWCGKHTLSLVCVYGDGFRCWPSDLPEGTTYMIQSMENPRFNSFTELGLMNSLLSSMSYHICYLGSCMGQKFEFYCNAALRSLLSWCCSFTDDDTNETS